AAADPAGRPGTGTAADAGSAERSAAGRAGPAGGGRERPPARAGRAARQGWGSAPGPVRHRHPAGTQPPADLAAPRPPHGAARPTGLTICFDMPSTNLPPDPVRDAGFPTVEQLRRGIMLDCIAHSFWLAAHERVFEMDWEGDTFLKDDSQGERWAVA